MSTPGLDAFGPTNDSGHIPCEAPPDRDPVMISHPDTEAIIEDQRRRSARVSELLGPSVVIRDGDIVWTDERDPVGDSVELEYDKHDDVPPQPPPPTTGVTGSSVHPFATSERVFGYGA